MRIALMSFLILVANSNIYAQGCCSGGAGSPIAGGAASGVLQEYQMEISVNHQFNQSNMFYTGSEVAEPLFENLKSNYLFFRTDYGVSKKLTLFVVLVCKRIFNPCFRSTLFIFPKGYCSKLSA
jgi:hypothetical protein